MDLSKMMKKQEPAQNEEQADGQRFSKEEYAAMKKAEREDLWARVDAQAQAVFQDDAAMKGFLDFMARCTPQSTRNLLILYEQNPEITHPRTFDMWAEAGRSVRNGESGYAFFTESKYEREDGTTGRGYDIVKAFDISQTRGPQVYAAQPHLPDEVIVAMIESSPVPLALSDQLPKGVQAQYVPNSVLFICAMGWMNRQPSAQSHGNRLTPLSTWQAPVIAGRRMRPRATVWLMWWLRNLAWIHPVSSSTRCVRLGQGKKPKISVPSLVM